MPLPIERKQELAGIIKKMQKKGEPKERIQQMVKAFEVKFSAPIQGDIKDSTINIDAMPPEVEQQPQQLDMVQYGKQNVVDPLLKGAMYAGGVLDRFGGAPSRAAVNELLNPRKEHYEQRLNLRHEPLLRAPLAFAKQFGRDPRGAPTSKQIFTEGGVTDKTLSELYPSRFSESGKGLRTLKKGGMFDVSPAGVMGLGGDVAFDVTNVVPLKTLGSLGLQGVKKGIGLGAKGSGKAIDYATGSNVMQKIGAGRKEFGSTFSKGIKSTFSGKAAEDYGTYLNIARRNNIDQSLLPESVKYGKSSAISRTARAKAEGPAGEQLLKRHEKAVQQVDGALADHVNKVSNGQIYAPDEVGTIIRDGFDRGVQKAFDELEVTYASILTDNPGLIIEPKALERMNRKLKKVYNKAEETVEFGASNEAKAAAQQILNNIESITKSGGDYATTLKQLRQVGNVSFGTGRKFKTPPDTESMKDLYSILRNALTDTADAINPNVGKQLKANNKIASKLIGEKSVLAKKMRNSDVSDEAIFKQFVLNGDTRKLKALKIFLNDDEWKAAKGSFMRSIMKENIEGDIAGRTVFNRLRDKESVVGVLFDSGEMDNFIDLLKLKERIGSPILSSSGTGASNVFHTVVKESIPRAAESGVAKIITTKAPPKSARATKVRNVIKGTLKPVPKASQVYSVQKRNEER